MLCPYFYSIHLLPLPATQLEFAGFLCVAFLNFFLLSFEICKQYVNNELNLNVFDLYKIFILLCVVCNLLFFFHQYYIKDLPTLLCIAMADSFSFLDITICNYPII